MGASRFRRRGALTDHGTYREFIELVREHSSVVEILTSRYAHTVSRGMACCPFHTDSTPSCSVSETVFHCFACHASGDVFHLVERLEGIPFIEAVNRLAEWAGLRPRVPMDADRATHLSEREIEVAIEVATAHYQTRLTPECWDYLQGHRRLPASVVQAARLGWADGTLVSRTSPMTLALAGLAVKVKNASTWAGVEEARDLLVDRLVFPVLRRGLGVFLSGRAMRPGQTPKYLHQRGRTTPLFNGDAVSAGRDCFITEGPVDALSLAAWGLPAVALQGTMNPSIRQALGQLSRALIVLDADSAGSQGALRVAAELGVSRVKVITLPSGLDMNDYFRLFTRESFLDRVRQPQDPVQALLSLVPYEDIEPGQLGPQLDRIFDLWRTLSPAEVRHYIDRLVVPWAHGRKGVVKAVEASWQRYQERPRQCHGCGAFIR